MEGKWSEIETLNEEQIITLLGLKRVTVHNKEQNNGMLRILYNIKDWENNGVHYRNRRK